MTIPAAEARARRQAKVDALATRATLAGERDAAEAASARLRATELPAARCGPPVVLPTDPRLTEREGEEVLAALYGLGYALVNEQESRLFGRIRVSYVDSDDGIHHLTRHLKETTPLAKLDGDAAQWFSRLCAGRRIMLPERHPSGMASQEAPHTNVQPLGAGCHTPGKRK
jgi:hypothetical protein